LWPMFPEIFHLHESGDVCRAGGVLQTAFARGGCFCRAHPPFAEILLGLLLLIGWGLRIWASLVTLLMLGFLTLVTRAYLLHMNINCGCFAIPEPLTIKTVIRDSLFALLAVLMTSFAFIEARQPHPWSAPEKISP